MNDLTAVGIAVLLLVGNAFFVGAEFALVSVRRTAVEEAASKGVPGARLTLRAVENVTLMMAGAQLGITMCSLGLGAIGEPAVAHLLEPLFEAASVPDALVHPISFVIAMTIVVFFHMTLGEMVPKNIAIAVPARSALIMGPPMYAIAWILKPLLWIMNGLANIVLRIMRIKPTRGVASTITTEDVPSYLEESAEVGLLDEHEHQLLTGALTLTSARVSDVLVPVDQLVWLGAAPTVAEAEQAAVTHGFSRFPVRGDDGSWRGYLHLKDVLDLVEGNPDAAVPADRIRDMAEVRSDTPLPDALATMQRSGVHLAIVTGPDGQVAGVAMLEDVMETMIGAVDAP
ncbi:hemolysin family protein [Granulicoccus sp. GXG6511]|uniref:hemolysin family protein n=1 Tax=Granulicoccus sp. GXG6511 TaxID=3381351 RepID=UPI003D7C9D8E